MEYVNKQSFYHIQAAAPWNSYPQWQIGETYTIGQGKNPFFAYFDNKGPNIINRSTNKIFSVDNVADLVLRHMEGQPQDPDLAAVFSYDAKATINHLRNGLSHYVKLVREIVYEEVRAHNFPELPSRQRCTWVVPEDANTNNYISYWWPLLNKNGRRILKVELTGKLHQANEEFLLTHTNPLNVSRQCAFRYWAGEQGSNINRIECLFEGIVNVLDVINPQVYGL